MLAVLLRICIMIKTQLTVTKRKTRPQKRKQTDQVSSCHLFKFVLTGLFTTVFLTRIRLGIMISLFCMETIPTGNLAYTSSPSPSFSLFLPSPHLLRAEMLASQVLWNSKRVTVVTVNKSTEKNRPDHKLALACPCFCCHVLFWWFLTLSSKL